MRKLKRPLSLAAMLFLLAAGSAFAQNTKFKTLDGKVLGNDNVPLESAIVYLQDSKTTNVRTFIATAGRELSLRANFAGHRLPGVGEIQGCEKPHQDD